MCARAGAGAENADGTIALLASSRPAGRYRTLAITVPGGIANGVPDKFR